MRPRNKFERKLLLFFELKKISHLSINFIAKIPKLKGRFELITAYWTYSC